jgi:hypothetical protein
MLPILARDGECPVVMRYSDRAVLQPIDEFAPRFVVDVTIVYYDASPGPTADRVVGVTVVIGNISSAVEGDSSDS